MHIRHGDKLIEMEGDQFYNLSDYMDVMAIEFPDVSSIL